MSTGSGGYFLACHDFGRMFDYPFPARAFLLLFFLVEFSSRTLIPLFMPGSVHSDSASRDDCDRVFPDKLRASSFLIGSFTMAGPRSLSELRRLWPCVP